MADDVRPSGHGIYAAEALNMVVALRALAEIGRMPPDIDFNTLGARLVRLDGFEMNRISFGKEPYMPQEALENLRSLDSKVVGTPAFMAAPEEVGRFIAKDVPVLRKGALALLHDAVTCGISDDGSGRLDEAVKTVKAMEEDIMTMCAEFGFDDATSVTPAR